MKKKLVLLNTGLNYGGMERVVFIAQKLLEKNFEVILVTLYANNPDYKLSSEYIDLKCPPLKGKIPKILNVFKRTIAVKKMKKMIKPDIVMSFGTAANFSNVASKNKEKVIVGIRSYDWLTNFFANYSIDKWTYNKADKVVSVSKLIKKDADKIFCLKNQKSEYLYNPYDINLIIKKADEPIKDFEMKKNGKNIISVGRLANQKGFNHLIKSFSLILKDFPNSNLVIIGKGEKEDLLKKLIRELGIESHVTLLGGKDNPYKYMKEADLYVLSSVSEGFPNAMVEAMAVGLPILAVDCKSGPREILSISGLHENNPKNENSIEKCDYGLIAPEVSGNLNYSADVIGDSERILAEGMKLFLGNASLREYYSSKSIERAKEFTYEKFENKLTEILNNN
ncbi:glycosyl transferase GT4 family protein [Planococcus donghaensis MPA1U2]|uniref:Glycosyl transferase GT4 family protein n=1 Tax=Planococcus donghaensis MPA1U2 TaxID=933115 RepID=E7RDS4_9BACL|nr:glycosyltransferase [Planococcus donghaensis]EGA90830.1 glycosyl transferase GT4 family protein [Planococcus donghaensis MPA1U2]